MATVQTPKPPSPYRPYRVTMYALFLIFTLGFIGAIIRGVWVDLFRKPASSGIATSVTACVDEANALALKLDSLSMTAFRQDGDWARITADFDGRLAGFQEACASGRLEAAPDVTSALSEAADRLTEYRRHLARCGEEGGRERAALKSSLELLRSTGKSTR